MQRLKRLDEKGFSFLASLFDLLVLMTMLPLIVLFYGFAVSFTEDLDPHQLEWQLFASDLQGYLNNSESIEIIEGGKGVRIVQREEEYDIEMYTDMFRKRNCANATRKSVQTSRFTCMTKMEHAVDVSPFF